jgi:hypothetical protein
MSMTLQKQCTSQLVDSLTLTAYAEESSTNIIPRFKLSKYFSCSLNGLCVLWRLVFHWLWIYRMDKLNVAESLQNCTHLPVGICKASNRGTTNRQTPWPEFANELYRPTDRRLSAKLAPSFADRGCHVVSAADPYDRNFGFLDRCRYVFFRVALQLYLRGWVNPVLDPLLLGKSSSAGNRIRTSGSVARNSDH